MSEQVNYLSDLKVKNLEAESILIKSKDGLSHLDSRFVHLSVWDGVL